MGSLLERCVQAGNVAAAACEMALAADDSYTNPGTEPYAAGHLALVSCTNVCSLVVRALRDGDGDVPLLRWCAETCSMTAAGEAPQSISPEVWDLVVRACKRCAFECDELIQRSAHLAHTALRASRDTDFQVLERQ